MAFPKRYAEFAARWRVPAGFVVGAVFFALARPTALSLAIGGGIACLGMLLRAWAAGHLQKNLQLTTSGPFAHVRNPLYLGTLLAGTGFAVAGGHLAIGVLLVSFFVFFYLPVVEEEERHLRTLFPGYAGYAARVRKFRPALAPQYRSDTRFRFAVYSQNREYQALLGFVAGMLLLVAKMSV